MKDSAKNVLNLYIYIYIYIQTGTSEKLNYQSMSE